MTAKGLHTWVGGWLRDRARKALLARPEGQRHLLVSICDHFEPLHGGAPFRVGLDRVRTWTEGYPEIARRFRDADDRTPRHTFFFPGEQYDPQLVEPLARLVEHGHGEVEVHLHHDGDTRATLRHRLATALDAFDAHGVVARRRGARAWSFVHGNWSLANGRPDGRWCGVDDELRLLHQMGCYADFTFPSAPDPCQPAIVNAIYWPRDDTRRRAYEEAERARAAAGRRDRVLMMQGPLAIARRARGERGTQPMRIEAGAIDAGDPPTRARLATWIAQWVHVDGRPEWTFVKLHAHGAPERNARVLLGDAMARFHEALLALGPPWCVHYVTAREMYNVACAAIEGLRGSPAAYLDYDVLPPERARPPRV